MPDRSGIESERALQRMSDSVAEAGAAAAAPALTIARATPERLADCEAVVREVFGFSDAEAAPAWLVHTSTLFGGVARMALVGDEVAGFAFAFPAVDEDGPTLFLSEVAVLPRHRGRGIAMRMLAEVRDEALALGHERMIWTTNALSSRNLHLYLVRCRTRLVRFCPGIYEALFAHHAPDAVNGDEVLLEWRLRDPAVVAALAGEPSPRPPARAPERVEIPYDADALHAAPPAERRAWRESVRAQAEQLLAAGWQGVDLAVDHAQQRSFVVFEEAERP